MQISEIKNGNMNKIYLLNLSDEKYIIRTSDFNNEFECKVLQLLKLHDYNCPKIITNFKLDQKYIMLYRYLEGENPINYDATFFRKMGTLLKVLHSFQVDFDKKEYEMNEENQEKMNSYYSKAIESNYLKNEREFLKSLLEDVNNLNLDQFNKCIVHSDIKKENMLVDKDDIYLLDFGNCYIGSRLIDVIRVIMWFFIKNGNYDYELIKTFVNEYFKNNSITNNEKENVNQFIEYCILYNLVKDISLNEDDILSNDYIENNSLNWLTALKQKEKIYKIGEIIKNA